MKSLSSKKLVDSFANSRNFLQANLSPQNPNFSLSSPQSSQQFKSNTIKSSLFEINKQKIKNRNLQLLKLFRSAPAQTFNLEYLQRSEYMKNEIFNYLVQCLKKQRQGMISFQTLKSEKAKDPKLIQNKIRQFLFNSLQQALLMSQKQLDSTNFFERLFEWFTDVFKEREMKLVFKTQASLKKDVQMHDEDWIIRNTYKSNMPLELANYQRKVLKTNHMADFSQKIDRNQLEKEDSDDILRGKQNQHQKTALSQNRQFNQFGQQKTFYHTANSSPSCQKSKQILPLLNRKNLLSNLSKVQQNRQKQELHFFQSQWKKQKSHYAEHTCKNFYNKKYLKDKVLFKEERISGQDKHSEFKLSKKVLQKIHAAKLGVTLADFRNNKENLDKLKNNTTYQSPVFHPNLSANYFNQIKKRKVERFQNVLLGPANVRKNQQKKTQQSEQGSAKMLNESPQNQNSLEFTLFDGGDSLEQIKSIDGIGLLSNGFEVTALKKKRQLPKQSKQKQKKNE